MNASIAILKNCTEWKKRIGKTCLRVLKNMERMTKDCMVKKKYEFKERRCSKRSTNLKKKVVLKKLKTLQSEEDVYEFEEIFKVKKWHNTIIK